MTYEEKCKICVELDRLEVEAARLYDLDAKRRIDRIRDELPRFAGDGKEPLKLLHGKCEQLHGSS